MPYKPQCTDRSVIRQPFHFQTAILEKWLTENISLTKATSVPQTKSCHPPGYYSSGKCLKKMLTEHRNEQVTDEHNNRTTLEMSV